jgi:multidrug efflux pump subunit AcrA (membrane-fusion protein)
MNLSSLKGIHKRPIFYIFVVIAVIVIIVLLVKGDDKSPDTVIITKGEIVSEVNVVANVKAAQEVDLGFEVTGRVSSVLADVGDKVYFGQTLVRLSSGSKAADLAKAEAQLKDQQAKLSELLRGARQEEIDIQEIKVESAKTSLSDAKQGVLDEVQNSFTKADDAVRNKIDILFSNPRSTSPVLLVSTQGSQLEINAELGRVVAESLLEEWESFVNSLSLSSDLESSSLETRNKLDEIRSFLDTMALVVNGLTVNSSLSQTTIDSYKTDVFSARTNVDTASSELSTAREKLQSAQDNLLLEEEELNLMIAGTASEQILSQEASVEEAEANVAKFRAEIAKTVITSPFSGIVTKQEASIGEIVSANENIVSLISEKDLQLEANIPESDVVDLKKGMEALITLDAFGDDREFRARIISIDPAGTIIEGVPTYKTTLEFISSGDEIKPGMTANVDIETGRRENVFSIPKRAVLDGDGNPFVRVSIDGSIVEKEVETGLLGSNGWIEITSGLKEGDEVIIFLDN